MADASQNYSYQLKPRLELEKIVSLLAKLNASTTLQDAQVIKDTFDLSTVPDISVSDFEITYRTDEFSLTDKLNPYAFQRLLVGLRNSLNRYADQNKLYSLIPKKTDENGPMYWMEGRYSFEGRLPDQTTQREIVFVLANVGQSLQTALSSKQAGQETPTGNIDLLTKELTDGTPEELVLNWSKVQSIIDGLLSLQDKARILNFSTLSEFGGTDHAKKTFSAGGLISLLKTYRKNFREKIDKHEKYKQIFEQNYKVDQDVKNALGNFRTNTSEIFPPFQDLDDITVDDSHRTSLKAYKEILKKVVSILLTVQPKLTFLAGTQAAEIDEGGGEPEEHIKTEGKTVGELVKLITNKLIDAIFKEHFEPLIKELNQPNYVIATLEKKILAEIGSSLNPNNPRPTFVFYGGEFGPIVISSAANLALNVHTGTLSEFVSDNKVIDSVELDAWIENLISSAVGEFSNPDFIKKFFDSTLAEILKIPEEELTKPKPDLSSAGVPQNISEQVYLWQEWNDESRKIIDKEMDFEAWQNAGPDEKRSFAITIWLKLSISERRRFLEKYKLDLYYDSYGQVVSEAIVGEYLAQSGFENASLTEFSVQITELKKDLSQELINISPVEVDKNIDAFLRKNSETINKLKPDLKRQYSGELESKINALILDPEKYKSLIPDLVANTNQAPAEIVANFSKDPKFALYTELILRDFYSEYQFNPEDGNNSFEIRDGWKKDKIKIFKELNELFLEYLNTNEGAAYLLLNISHRQILFNNFNDYIKKSNNPRTIEFLRVFERDVLFYKQQQLLISSAGSAGRLADIQYKKNIESTTYLIFTQAVMSQMDPLDYLNSLSNEELKNLFDLPFAVNDEAKFREFKHHLFLYVKTRKKELKIDQKITEGQELDKQAFTSELVEFRSLTRSISRSPDRDKQLFEAVAMSDEELTAMEEREIGFYEQRRRLAEAIYAAYTEEERAIIEEYSKRQLLGEAQINEMAIFEWNKALVAAQAAQTQDVPDQPGEKPGFRQRLKTLGGKSKTKPKGRTRKLLESQARKLGVGLAGAAAGLAIPGAGAVAAVINGLPIPERAKKYLQMGIMGAVVSAVGGFIYLVTHSIGAAVGGAIGFVVGGPLGVVPGALIGYGIEYTIKEGATKAYDSLVNLTGDAGRSIGNFFSNVGSGIGNVVSGVGSGISSIASGIWGGATGVATPIISSIPGITVSTFAATGIILGAPIVATTVNQGTFLQILPTVDPAAGEISQYVTIQKIASPGIKFNDPEAITYKIFIKPKEGYSITLTSAEDEISISCNDEARGNSDCPDTTGPEFEEYRGFTLGLNSLEHKVITYGERVEIGSYTIGFDGKYQHTSINNRFSINFDVSGKEAALNQSAITSESICFGECPQEKDWCWPTDGSVTQTPYNQYFADGSPATHRIVDAMDIGGQSPAVFSSTTGRACFFGVGSGIPVGSGFPYGNHVFVEDVDVDGKKYGLLYAHLATLAQPSGTCDDNLQAGDFLGVMGATGGNWGVHLHWELRVKAKPDSIGWTSYTSGLPGQNAGTDPTLLEQFSPSEGGVRLGDPVRTCYER